MMYTGSDYRSTVTIHLSFVDEPVTIVNINELTFHQAQLMQTDGKVEEALSELLDPTFHQILMHTAHDTDVAEFFTKWADASNEAHQAREDETSTFNRLFRQAFRTRDN